MSEDIKAELKDRIDKIIKDQEDRYPDSPFKMVLWDESPTSGRSGRFVEFWPYQLRAIKKLLEL